MINDAIYRFALWVDSTSWSTQLHESFYMYNWIESTHVLSLMLSLGLLFIIDFRLLGFFFTDLSIETMTNRLMPTMLIGFGITFVTGVLLFYAIPVRTSQSIWFRIKVIFLVLAAINALWVHYKMAKIESHQSDQTNSSCFRVGALFSLFFWISIVIAGRLIAYDWFDCVKNPSAIISTIAGCVDNQSIF